MGKAGAPPARNEPVGWPRPPAGGSAPQTPRPSEPHSRFVAGANRTVSLMAAELSPVLVLGMHRSGTSAVTALLAQAGAPLPGAAGSGRRSNPANAEGFREVPSLSDLDERVLRALGGHWSAPPDLAAGWHQDPRLSRLRARAARSGSTPPRHARHALEGPPPRGRAAVLGRGHHRAAVIVLRNPFDVAASLEARNGISEVVAFALWERYLTGALEHSAGRPTLILRYEDVLLDPDRHLVEAGAWLAEHGIVPNGSSERPDSGGVLHEHLRHHRNGHQLPPGAVGLTPSQDALHDATMALVGAHRRFAPPQLPAAEETSRRALADRRARLEGRLGTTTRAGARSAAPSCSAPSSFAAAAADPTRSAAAQPAPDPACALACAPGHGLRSGDDTSAVPSGPPGERDAASARLVASTVQGPPNHRFDAGDVGDVQVLTPVADPGGDRQPERSVGFLPERAVDHCFGPGLRVEHRLVELEIELRTQVLHHGGRVLHQLLVTHLHEPLWRQVAGGDEGGVHVATPPVGSDAERSWTEARGQHGRDDVCVDLEGRARSRPRGAAT